MLKYAYLGVGLALTVGSVQALPMGSLVDSSSGSEFIQSVRHHHHHHNRGWDRDDRWRGGWRNDYYYNDYRNDWRYRDNDDVRACIAGICVDID